MGTCDIRHVFSIPPYFYFLVSDFEVPKSYANIICSGGMVRLSTQNTRCLLAKNTKRTPKTFTLLQESPRHQTFTLLHQFSGRNFTTPQTKQNFARRAVERTTIVLVSDVTRCACPPLAV